ncbi:hypothetical protein F7C95_15395 [Opitutia bacterium ISCC 51]|nr:hypothetical protein F7C95_15395 [Opitutae bacterium ISCC 51]
MHSDHSHPGSPWVAFAEIPSGINTTMVIMGKKKKTDILNQPLQGAMKRPKERRMG